MGLLHFLTEECKREERENKKIKKLFRLINYFIKALHKFFCEGSTNIFLQKSKFKEFPARDFLIKLFCEKSLWCNGVKSGSL